MARGPAKGTTNNPNGRPKGTLNAKTVQWEALAESIVGLHAEGFNEIMKADFVDAMEHEDEEMKAAARARYANNYTKILDYFKPKLQRITQVGEEGAPPVQIVISESVMKKV